MFEYFEEMTQRLNNHPYGDEIKNFILKFEDDELKKYLSFLYLYMPYGDIANVDREIVLDYALAGVNLRRTRCADMDEELFLNYVLYHRLGSEKIVANRRFFYELIKDLLGDNERDNVIKLNYWCSKNVTYRTTDTRTLDPVSVYNSSFGRCGEESIFAVSVLRAAGIPARQIYVPLWAHCDDNHAWMEVYVDKDWHYLGACEGEEILDKGWFDDASARAMIVKNILYGVSKSESKDIISFNEGMYEINQTKRYAQTKHIKLHLSEGDTTLSNRDFNICLLNFGGFYPIIKAKTDDSGNFETDIGLGRAFVSLYKERNYIIPFNTGIEDEFYLDLSEYETEYNKYNEILITVPAASVRNRKKALQKKNYGYNQKPFPNETVKNMAYSEGMKELWESLWEKDKRDISIEVLRDAYLSPNTYSVNRDVYLNYIQNPRVNFENLNPCREIFRKNFLSKEDLLDFISGMSLTGERLITEPLGVFNTKIASSLSIKIFAVNVLRSMGIASRIINSNVCIYEENIFRIFKELSEVLERLKYIDNRLIYEDSVKKEISHIRLLGDLNTFGETFCISKFDKYEKALVSLDKSSIKEDMDLEEGEYVLSTSNRLPNGNICCKYNILKLEPGANYEIKLEYMQADLNDMLTEFVLPTDLGNIPGVLEGDKDISLLMWLKEEEEPTQHIANDLLLKEDLLKSIDIKLLFTNEFENRDTAVNELLNKSGKNKIITNLGENLQETFGRSLFVNHETLPIVALCKGNRAVYAFSGYQVGSGNLIEKIWEILKQGEYHE